MSFCLILDSSLEGFHRLGGKPEVIIVLLLFECILVYLIILQGRRGTTNNLKQLFLLSPVFSCLSCAISVSLSFLPFFCLLLFFIPFTVSCRIVLAKPEDLRCNQTISVTIALPVSGVCHKTDFDVTQNHI